MTDNIFQGCWEMLKDGVKRNVDSGDLFFKRKELANKKGVLKDLEEGEIQKGTKEDICLFLGYNFECDFDNKTIEELKKILKIKISELEDDISELEKEIEELRVDIKK